MKIEYIKNNNIFNTFNNKYKIIKKINNGAVGNVFLIIKKENNEELVMKININKNTYIHMKNEIEIYEKIKNIIPDNICNIHDIYIFENEKVAFFTMDKINHKYIHKLHFNILINLLEKMHKKFIYHLDIYDNNIGYNKNNNNIILFDFGHSKIMKEENKIYKLTEFLFLKCYFSGYFIFGIQLRQKIFDNYNNINLINIIQERINKSEINIKVKKELFYIINNYNNNYIYQYLITNL